MQSRLLRCQRSHTKLTIGGFAVKTLLCASSSTDTAEAGHGSALQTLHPTSSFPLLSFVFNIYSMYLVFQIHKRNKEYDKQLYLPLRKQCDKSSPRPRVCNPCAPRPSPRQLTTASKNHILPSGNHCGDQKFVTSTHFPFYPLCIHP